MRQFFCADNNTEFVYAQGQFDVVKRPIVYAQDLGSCRGNYEKTDQRDIMSIVRCIYEI